MGRRKRLEKALHSRQSTPKLGKIAQCCPDLPKVTDTLAEALSRLMGGSSRYAPIVSSWVLKYLRRFCPVLE